MSERRNKANGAAKDNPWITLSGMRSKPGLDTVSESVCVRVIVKFSLTAKTGKVAYPLAENDRGEFEDSVSVSSRFVVKDGQME